MPLRFAAVVLAAAIAAAQDPPPPLGDHVERTSAFDREHVHHAAVTGTVLDAAGKPVAGARVYLYGRMPWWGPVPVAAGATDASGRYRLAAVAAAGWLTVFATTPRGEPFASAFVSLGLVSGRTTELRPLALPAPVAGAAAFVFRGRLVGASGRPLGGAMWQLHHGDTFDPGAYATTDADGRFEVHSELGKPSGGTLFAGGVRYRLEHADGAANVSGSAGMIASDLDLVTERTIELPAVAVVTPAAPGVDGVTFHQSRGPLLVPCVGAALMHVAGHGHDAVHVWAHAPGRLPRGCSLPQETFDFAGDQPRSLRVVDDGGAPVVGAMVDVCAAWPGSRLAETTLATYRTGDGGVLALRGPADEYVVYVYAPGHAPARARWRAGSTPQVVLARCSARLRVTCGDTAASLYVRPAGTFGSCAKLYPAPGEHAVELVPGDYELTVYGERGIAAAAAVTVADDTTIAMPVEDHRPELVVTVAAAAAGDACWAYASRSMTGGMITKWSIHSQRGGPMPRNELAATVDELPAAADANGVRRFRVRLPTSGRATVLVGNGDLGGGGVRFFREGTFAFGRKYALELPAPAGALHGTVAKYPDEWESPFRGVVGPRLCLEPSGATPWGVLVALPEPAAFRLPALQPGTFVLHHHLYETGILFSTDGTWGGAPVTLAKDAPLVVDGLGRGPDAELAVTVRDRAGAPVVGRLWIRDRMFECWSDDLRQNTTLDDAADPIPNPPAAELVDGRCTLPKVRAGTLAFVLARDDGSLVHFARAVDPAQPLVVALDVPPPVTAK
jgi:hypothetical protein